MQTELFLALQHDRHSCSQAAFFSFRLLHLQSHLQHFLSVHNNEGTCAGSFEVENRLDMAFQDAGEAGFEPVTLSVVVDDIPGVLNQVGLSSESGPLGLHHVMISKAWGSRTPQNLQCAASCARRDEISCTAGRYEKKLRCCPIVQALLQVFGNCN